MAATINPQPFLFSFSTLNFLNLEYLTVTPFISALFFLVFFVSLGLPDVNSSTVVNVEYFSPFLFFSFLVGSFNFKVFVFIVFSLSIFSDIFSSAEAQISFTLTFCSLAITYHLLFYFSFVS
jgi:hypothetical protein